MDLITTSIQITLSNAMHSSISYYDKGVRVIYEGPKCILSDNFIPCIHFPVNQLCSVDLGRLQGQEITFTCFLTANSSRSLLISIKLLFVGK